MKTQILHASLLASSLLTGVVAAQKPDLTVTKFTFPTVWKAGATHEYAATVANIGTTIATSTQLGIFESANSIISNGDKLLKTNFVPSMNPNTIFVAKGNMKASQLQLSGNVYIGALADRLGKISELKENNNYKSQKVQYVARPNLVITQINVPALIAPNQSFSITATVKNTGPIAAPKSRVGLVSSLNPSITRFDRAITSVPVDELAPNASKNIVFSSFVRGWPTAFDGAQYIGVVADIAGDIDESNETNGKGVLRNVPKYQGSGAYLTYEQPRYGTTAGATSPWSAYFNDQGGSAKIAITAPGRPFHSYVLVWSQNSAQVQVNAVTELGLGLLGTPMMPGWIGKADAFGRASATFNMPAGFDGFFTTHTHSVWFDPNFTSFVGFGSNSLRTWY